MLVFQRGVYAHVFQQQIALVLHHVSVWSEMTGIGAKVNALADRGHMASSLHFWDLAVDVGTDGEKPADLAQLAGYLERNLEPTYDVVREADHVHVEWDVKRKPAPVTPVFQTPTPPAT